jgi:hypothetical protein
VWIVGHHAWGRLTLQRIKLYYRQFQAKAAGVAAAAAGRG